MTVPNVEAPAAPPAAEAAPAPEYTGRESIDAIAHHAADRAMPPAPPEAPVAPPPAEPPANASAAAKRAWKLYQGDQEVTDFSKITLDDVFGGKVQIGYNANKAEQRRAFDEVVRNAALGHYNAERMNQLQNERNTTVEKLRTFEQQLTAHGAEKKAWDGALHAASQGNFAPLETMLQAYMDALGKAPEAPAPATVPLEQVERERQGQQVYEQVVMPRATELAQQYNIPAQDIAQAVVMLVNAEPPEFLTPARLQQIMDVELVQHIEQFVGTQPAPAAPPSDLAAQLAALQAENAQLKTAAAGKHNAAVDAVHQRRAAAPPPASGGPAANGGIESPNFGSAQEAREWLRNLKA